MKKLKDSQIIYKILVDAILDVHNASHDPQHEYYVNPLRMLNYSANTVFLYSGDWGEIKVTRVIKDMHSKGCIIQYTAKFFKNEKLISEATMDLGYKQYVTQSNQEEYPIELIKDYMEDRHIIMELRVKKGQDDLPSINPYYTHSQPHIKRKSDKFPSVKYNDLTQEDKEKIIQEYNSGTTFAQLSTKYHISIGVFKKLLGQNNTDNKEDRLPRSYDDNIQMRIVQDLIMNASCSFIPRTEEDLNKICRQLSKIYEIHPDCIRDIYNRFKETISRKAKSANSKLSQIYENMDKIPDKEDEVDTKEKIDSSDLKKLQDHFNGIN